MSTQFDSGGGEYADADESKPRTAKQENLRDKLKRLFKPFSLGGYFNYAFIYGSWEVVRARKVGTTHTRVDYVIYRLFYPVILIGACLFGVVEETDLGRFFSMLPTWAMILHITYAFIFLKNVLANNLHRENVKHRQKIPERLVVTAEIEKGGHKFYICRRFSILPTDSLYNTERILYLLFNIVVPFNVSIMVASKTGLNKQVVSANQPIGSDMIRAWVFGIAAIAEIPCTPIPMRLAHVIYPVLFFIIYLFFSYRMYLNNGIVLYRFANFADENAPIWRNLGIRVALLVMLHFFLTGFCALRDYIISLLDDSRTESQIQNLRAQKRLARRKIMNYIEGPDGRVIGISLEKHSYAPTMDEFIQTEKTGKRKEDEEKRNNESSSSSSEEEQMEPDEQTGDESKPKMGGGRGSNKKATTTILSSGKPLKRYKNIYVKALRFSSSSSDEDIKKRRELEQLKNIRLPSPPKEVANLESKNIGKKTKIPVPIKKLGLHVKPRDSKENIHHHLDIIEHSDSPPTPPLVKLVQTMIKVQTETKKEVKEIKQQKQAARNATESPARKKLKRDSLEDVEAVSRSSLIVPGNYALVKVIRTADEKKMEQELEKKYNPAEGMGKGYRDQKKNQKKSEEKVDIIVKTDDEGKPRGSKVVDLSGRSKLVEKKGFHSEVVKKLEEEKSRRSLPSRDTKTLLKAPSIGGGDGATELRKKDRRKGILKEEIRRPSVDKRREMKLIRRRDERVNEGKVGQAVYDPVSVPVPDIPQQTTFHYLGTKLKGEHADKNIVGQDQLALFKSHPGLTPTQDKPDFGPLQPGKTMVAFHPVVRYFNMNEVNKRKDQRSKDTGN